MLICTSDLHAYVHTYIHSVKTDVHSSSYHVVTCIATVYIYWGWYTVRFFWLLCVHIYAVLCIEVHVALESSNCDSGISDQLEYICNHNGKDPRRIILRCCTNPTPCVGWTAEWWYKDPTKSNSFFQKYQQIEDSKTASVYVNNSNHPIRYRCTISGSHDCKQGSGHVDIQEGTYMYIIL